MSEKPGVGGRESGVGEEHDSETAPDRARESEVGSRGAELASPADASAPTTDNRQPTTDSGSRESNRSQGLEFQANAPTPDPRLPTPSTANWPLLYSAVLIELAILIILFYAFTKALA
jgi:hypothetical protein